MSDASNDERDDEAARKARAQRLHEQIEELKKGTAPVATPRDLVKGTRPRASGPRK